MCPEHVLRTRHSQGPATVTVRTDILLMQMIQGLLLAGACKAEGVSKYPLVTPIVPLSVVGR